MAAVVTDQVGALPYRIDAAGRAEVLLITSRDTGRWIVPKGNPIPGLAPHEAAAQEAYEEAGVHGIPCPAAIGSYNYDKHRRLGAPRRLRVTLFPLAVTAEAADWPERHQRRTGWFAPDRAATMVAEPELAQLIARFRLPPAAAPSPSAPHLLPGRTTTTGKVTSMLGWFQSLMPRQGRFFEQFEAHAATLVAGADALARLFHGEGAIREQIDEIVAREHQADDITRDVLQDVRRIFVTPFDRSAITDLISTMDDAIDQMNQTATTVTLYGLTAFDAPMRDMTGIIVEAARLTAEMIPLLRSLGPNATRLHELTARMIEIEGHADAIHDDGIRTLFAAKRDDPMGFIVGREVYSHLERIVDRFEDVANEVQGLVIDHA